MRKAASEAAFASKISRSTAHKRHTAPTQVKSAGSFEVSNCCWWRSTRERTRKKLLDMGAIPLHADLVADVGTSLSDRHYNVTDEGAPLGRALERDGYVGGRSTLALRAASWSSTAASTRCRRINAIWPRHRWTDGQVERMNHNQGGNIKRYTARRMSTSPNSSLPTVSRAALQDSSRAQTLRSYLEKRGEMSPARSISADRPDQRSPGRLVLVAAPWARVLSCAAIVVIPDDDAKGAEGPFAFHPLMSINRRSSIRRPAEQYLRRSACRPWGWKSQRFVWAFRTRGARLDGRSNRSPAAP